MTAANISSLDAVRSWTETDSFNDFVQTAYRRSPYAEAGTAEGAKSLLSVDTVCTLVTSGADLDALVVRNGRLLSQTPPASLDDLKMLLANGCSLVLRNVQRHESGLAELARVVEDTLQGTVAVQLYITPKGHHSFGWHYDAEEVIILQTEGTKEYFLRENTVNPRPTPETMPRDMQFERETTDISSCTLVAGDWMHIPSGWWHMAKAYDHSLSISIGLLHRQ